MDTSATALILPTDPSGSIFSCTRHRVLFTPRGIISRPSPFVVAHLGVSDHPEVLQVNSNGQIGLWEAPGERSWVISADLRGVSPTLDPAITWFAVARCRFFWAATRLKHVSVILPAPTLQSMFRVLGDPLTKGRPYAASLTPRRSPACIRDVTPFSYQLWIDALIEGTPCPTHQTQSPPPTLSTTSSPSSPAT